MNEKKKTKKKPDGEHKPSWKEYIATVQDIEQFLGDHVFLRHNMVHQISAVRLGLAFKRLGFAFRRTNTMRGYIVVLRSADEIKSRLRSMADGNSTVTGDG